MVALLVGLMARSIYEIYSGGVTSMSSNSWVCGGSWFSLVSTPVIGGPYQPKLDFG